PALSLAVANEGRKLMYGPDAAIAAGRLLGIQAGMRAILETFLAMTPPQQRSGALEKTLQSALVIIAAAPIKDDRKGGIGPDDADVLKQTAVDFVRATFVSAQRRH